MLLRIPMPRPQPPLDVFPIAGWRSMCLIQVLVSILVTYLMTLIARDLSDVKCSVSLLHQRH